MSTEVAPGAQIMLRQGDTAVIAYSGDCSVRVGEGRACTISSMVPCESGARMIDFTTFLGLASYREASHDHLFLVGRGVAMAAGIVVGIVYLSDGDKKPASAE